MLGDSLLVAPILNPGSKARAVYLPESKWLNLWNGKIYKKGWNFVEADLKTIPVFLKENSAIITTNVKESAEEPWDKITIETFLTKNVNVKIYDDDGITFNYKKGEFFEIELNIKKEKNKLKINTNILNDKFEPSFNKIEVKILNKINIERAFLNNKEYDFSKHEGFIFLEFDLKELMGK
jgi:alpha-glucosidase